MAPYRAINGQHGGRFAGGRRTHGDKSGGGFERAQSEGRG